MTEKQRREYRLNQIFAPIGVGFGAISLTLVLLLIGAALFEGAVSLAIYCVALACFCVWAIIAIASDSQIEAPTPRSTLVALLGFFLGSMGPLLLEDEFTIVGAIALLASVIFLICGLELDRKNRRKEDRKMREQAETETDPKMATSPVTPPERPELPEPPKRSTADLIVIVLVVSIVALALSIWVFAALDVREARFWKSDRSIDWFGVTRAAVTAAGALGVGVGVALAYLRQRLGENQLQLALIQQFDENKRDNRDHLKDVDARRRDRFTTVTEQLAHAGATVRIAGVYSLAALADEWLSDLDDPELADSARREAQVCIDVLCSYLRTKPTEIDEAVPASPQDASSEDDPNADDLPNSETAKGPVKIVQPTAPWDVEVRQTIVRVIRDRLHTVGDPQSWGTPDSWETPRPGPWSDFSFDFTGAVFHGEFDFSRISPSGAVIFRNCIFRGGRTFFNNSWPGSTAKVIFDGAQFAGSTVSFAMMMLGDNVSFRRCRFSGGVVFFSANWILRSPSFRWSTISGAFVSFEGPRVNEGEVLDLSEIIVNREGQLLFRPLVGDKEGRMHGEIRLDYARFEGGMTTFEIDLATESETGFVSFRDIEFSVDEYAPMSTHWNVGEPPTRWPDRSIPSPGPSTEDARAATDDGS